mgnify:CR=1 FL=1
MSYIPSHAMPHAYVHDEEDDGGARRQTEGARSSNALKIAGGALLGFLLYKALR